MTTELTTADIAAAIWGCSASDLCAEGATRCAEKDVYPDPAGNCVGKRPYAGTELRGWFAARLDGTEVVTVEDTGNMIRFSASEMVLGRLGHGVSGREGKRLRAFMAA